jgi:hypothetical protein
MMIIAALTYLVARAQAASQTEDIKSLEFSPRCGLVAMELPEMMLVYETWTIHFGVSVQKQEDIVISIKRVISTLDTLITKHPTHALKDRIATLTLTVRRIREQLLAIKDFEKDTRTLATLNVQFPLLPETLADEEGMLDYLCTVYQANCGKTKTTGTLNDMPTTVYEDVNLLEDICNELENINLSTPPKNDIIKWSVAQLNTWRNERTVCDISLLQYDQVLKKILSSYDDLLGHTITLPCLSSRQVYTPYSLITLPLAVDGKLWQLDFGKEMMVLLHNETKTSIMINPLELKLLYHYSKELPYFEGNGLSQIETPSYVAVILPDLKVSAPETCTMIPSRKTSYKTMAHLMAYGKDKVIATNFRQEETLLQYIRGTKSAKLKLPAGNSLLTLADDLRLQPSLLTFIADFAWRKLAVGIHYTNDPYTESKEIIDDRTVTLINDQSSADWINQLLEGYLGVSIEATLIAVVLLLLFLSGMFTSGKSIFHRCRVNQKRRHQLEAKRTQLVKHSEAVLKAVDPFLPGSESPSQW